MKHYGDITKINGAEVPAVDIITGGSPCQDLSVAGKRAGLAGERSGLFMEQMRIVKEMRERDVRDNGRTGFAVRPRYMVWENVPGAFSSGNPKGADFAAVIEEIIKVAEPDANVSVCVPNGGWTKSGCYYAEDGSWSIAWRVHDAQFWGVPQRRKRIALVADFGGLSAPEILFERKGLSGDTESCGETRKRTAGATGSGVEGASTYCLQGNGIDRFAAGFSYGQSAKARSLGYEEELSPTLRGGEGGNQKPCVYDARGNGEPLCVEMTSTKNTIVENGVSPTLTARMGTGGNQVNAVCVGNGQLNQMSMAEQANTLDTMHDQQAVIILPFDTTQIVRRLTPLECERLQGYPDGWTDIGEWTDTKGKKHKPADSPRYKALGNSIALPFWAWLARRICAQYERPVTLASLFDGIGGFPLVFSRCGAVPVWASEIEEFPIAVTKKHFPEE